MLKKFTVSNYRVFDKQITIDFSKVRDYRFSEECIKEGLINKAILYGKNAVGKTNLGMAILDVKTMVSGTSTPESVGFINAKSLENEDFARFEYTFKLEDDEIEYIYEKYNENKIRFEALKINQRVLYEFNFDTHEGDFSEFEKYNELTLLNLDEWDDEVSVLTYILNNTKLKELIVLKELQSFVKGMAFLQATENGVRFLGPKRRRSPLINKMINEEDSLEKFTKFLREVGVDVKLKVDVTPEGEKELYFDYEKKLLKFTSHASSGTRSLMGLYYILQDLEKLTFLYVDEFDANFHFELAKTMLEKFKQQSNCQILTTTHNTDLMSNKFMRPDCYFLMFPNKIIPVADATARELRQGHNLEKLYQAGEFDEAVAEMGE